MVKLLENVNQQPSSIVVAVAEEPFDEGFFQQFMKKTSHLGFSFFNKRAKFIYKQT